MCPALALLAVFSVSCSENNSVVTPPRTAVVYTFIGDAPACDVLSFRLNVNNFALRRAGTENSIVAIFPTASLFLSPRLDFAALRDYSTVMYLTPLQVDTYDRADLTLQLPKIVIYDPSQDPPVRTLSGIFPRPTVRIPLQPEFSVTDTGINVLRFDFDMAKSLQVDAQGQVTDRVNPVMTAVQVPKGADNKFGSFDNLAGFISSVSTNPVGRFMGSFNLQILNGTGQTIPISVSPDTILSGVSDLKSLETGRVTEVMATVDDGGNFVAEKVQVEDRVNVDENRIAFYGTVLPTPIKDANGNTTQLKLFVRAEDPDRNIVVPLDSVVTVNLSPGTVFQTSPQPDSLSALAFAPDSVAVGQELLVHGQFTAAVDLPTVVDASSVYLRSQTLQGGLSSFVEVASDGRTGAFWFSGCSTFLQTTPIMVMTTVSDTTFINVFGLSELSSQATLYVRGFPYFVKDATVIRGVPVPAGTLVLFARQIRQVN